MYSHGYLVTTIADALGITTMAVRRSLRRTVPKQPVYKTNPVKEAEKLLAEGFSPEVVRANFGDLMEA